MVVRRAIDTNTISLEFQGSHTNKYKVDDSVNKSYLRAIMDTRQGYNRDGIHQWKILDNRNVTDGILYTQISIYNLLKDSIDNQSMDRKFYIVDTLLTFSICNNPTLSKHAIDSLSLTAVTSPTFFQNTLFFRLCRKLAQFDSSFLNAEREKYSAFMHYPHRAKSIKRLITNCLHGFRLSRLSQLTFIEQNAELTGISFLYLLLA